MVERIKAEIGTAPFQAIAERHGVSDTTVRAIADGRTWKHVAGKIRRRNFNYKLSPSDVLDIRARHAAGEMQKTLAAEYGVVPSAISQIVHYRRRPRPESERVYAIS